MEKIKPPQFPEMHWLCELSPQKQFYLGCHSPYFGRILSGWLVLRAGLLVKAAAGTLGELWPSCGAARDKAQPSARSETRPAKQCETAQEI